jgi:hypothetical protein
LLRDWRIWISCSRQQGRAHDATAGARLQDGLTDHGATTSTGDQTPIFSPERAARHRATADFWEELVLSLVGPLLTATAGTMVLGLWAARVTQRWQARREDAALRESLIREVLEVSSALYLSLRHFEQVTDHPEPWRDVPTERRRVDDVYLRTRTAGDAIEYRLVAHFDSEELARKWHSVMDLLTTRYLQLVGAQPESYLRVMVGPAHTTLSADELATPEHIFERYKTYARHLPTLILDAARRQA